MDCPLLENFMIEPFVFANGLWAVRNGQQQLTYKEGLRGSMGFGLSCQLSSFAVEFYYNLAVRGQTKDETKTVFQINFGVD